MLACNTRASPACTFVAPCTCNRNRNEISCCDDVSPVIWCGPNKRHLNHPQFKPIPKLSQTGKPPLFSFTDHLPPSFPRSISPDAVFKKTKITLHGGGEVFYAHGAMALRPGFTAIMPWKVERVVSCQPGLAWPVTVNAVSTVSCT